MDTEYYLDVNPNILNHDDTKGTNDESHRMSQCQIGTNRPH